MNETTREHLFDPFFSTKGDEGTGLGLTQVYGFVQRSGGEITVSSDIGQGSEFVLYFPPDLIGREISEDISKEVNLKGDETILIVDDEEALRNLTQKFLMNRGYQTFTADGGEQALSLLKEHPIDLVITDVIMPDMNGYQLSSIMQKEYPCLKIQLVSGFSGEEKVEMVDQVLLQNLLHKPYDLSILCQKVRALLDTS